MYLQDVAFVHHHSGLLRKNGDIRVATYDKEDPPEAEVLSPFGGISTHSLYPCFGKTWAQDQVGGSNFFALTFYPFVGFATHHLLLVGDPAG